MQNREDYKKDLGLLKKIFFPRYLQILIIYFEEIVMWRQNAHQFKIKFGKCCK